MVWEATGGMQTSEMMRWLHTNQALVQVGFVRAAGDRQKLKVTAFAREMRAMRLPLRQEEIARLCHRLDVDGDGSISLAELQRVLSRGSRDFVRKAQVRALAPGRLAAPAPAAPGRTCPGMRTGLPVAAQ